jgi:hypothetical protein
MDLRTLTTVIDFETHTEGLEKVNGALEHINQKLEFLAATEFVKSIYELSEKYGHLGEEIESAAAQAGLTAQAFQQLAFAGSQNAISQGEMSSTLARLSRQIGAARDGSKSAIEAFAKVGITEDQVKGFKNASEGLQGIADHIQSIEDPIKRTQAMMALMGRGSVKMAKLMAQGGAGIRAEMQEAERVGAVVSNSNIENLSHLEDAMSAVGTVTKATVGNLVGMFAPVVTRAAKSMLNFWGANQKVIQANFHKWAGDAAFAFGFVRGLVETLGQGMLNFISRHQALVAILGGLYLKLIAFSLGIKVLAFAFSPLTEGVAKVIEYWKTFTEVVPEPFLKLLHYGTKAKGILGGLFVWAGRLTAFAFPALGEAIAGLGAFIAGVGLGTFIGIVGALVVACHDLWTLWSTGKVEDTWLYKMIVAIKGLSLGVLKKLGLYTEPPAQGTGQGPLLPEQDNSPRIIGDPNAFVGPPDPQRQSYGAKLISDKYQQAKDYISKIPLTEPDRGPPPGLYKDWNTTINAPITVNVPAGADPKQMAEAAKQGVRDHLDMVNRQAALGTRQPAIY